MSFISENIRIWNEKIVSYFPVPLQLRKKHLNGFELRWAFLILGGYNILTILRVWKVRQLISVIVCTTSLYFQIQLHSFRIGDY